MSAQTSSSASLGSSGSSSSSVASSSSPTSPLELLDMVSTSTKPKTTRTPRLLEPAILTSIEQVLRKLATHPLRRRVRFSESIVERAIPTLKSKTKKPETKEEKPSTSKKFKATSRKLKKQVTGLEIAIDDVVLDDDVDRSIYWDDIEITKLNAQSELESTMTSLAELCSDRTIDRMRKLGKTYELATPEVKDEIRKVMRELGRSCAEKSSKTAQITLAMKFMLEAQFAVADVNSELFHLNAAHLRADTEFTDKSRRSAIAHTRAVEILLPILTSLLLKLKTDFKWLHSRKMAALAVFVLFNQFKHAILRSMDYSKVIPIQRLTHFQDWLNMTSAGLKFRTVTNITNPSHVMVFDFIVRAGGAAAMVASCAHVFTTHTSAASSWKLSYHSTVYEKLNALWSGRWVVERAIRTRNTDAAVNKQQANNVVENMHAPPPDSNCPVTTEISVQYRQQQLTQVISMLAASFPPRQPDQVLFLISSSWYQRWHTFVSAETSQQVSSSSTSPGPGPIDNWHLAKHNCDLFRKHYSDKNCMKVKYDLVDGLEENVHFKAVPLAAWNLLREAYGGGAPPFPRRVNDDGKLDLYPEVLLSVQEALDVMACESVLSGLMSMNGVQNADSAPSCEASASGSGSVLAQQQSVAACPNGETVSWQCEACTFLNTPDASTCSICDTSSPTAQLNKQADSEALTSEGNEGLVDRDSNLSSSLSKVSGSSEVALEEIAFDYLLESSYDDFEEPCAPIEVKAVSFIESSTEKTEREGFEKEQQTAASSVDIMVDPSPPPPPLLPSSKSKDDDEEFLSILNMMMSQSFAELAVSNRRHLERPMLSDDEATRAAFDTLLVRTEAAVEALQDLMEALLLVSTTS